MATTTTANENKQNGYEQELAAYERDLAGYLQERIKPGLSSGAIPLLARSIAKEIARREPPEPPEGEDTHAGKEQADFEAGDEQPDAEAGHEQPDAEAGHEQPDAEAGDEQPDAEAGDEQPDTEAGDEPPDFEADMHELQAELGEEWVLRFSVHGEDGWLTAEKQDGTQRVEALDAQRLVTIVDAINEGRVPHR
jgi:hypothetical protein